MTMDGGMDSNGDEYTKLLTELHHEYCRDGPQDALQYCANFFNRKLEEERMALHGGGVAPSSLSGFDECHPLENASEQDDQDDRDDSQDDDMLSESDDEDPSDLLAIPSYNPRRRTSVSAEPCAPSNDTFVKSVIPKTDQQRALIKSGVQNNFLFRQLNEEQYEDVVNAMQEKHVPNGVKVIVQGDSGDYFYVVESGTFDCFIKTDGESKKITDYSKGGSFGELALMYNAPRAATIVATSDAVLWQLDRITFRQILMNSMSQKRRMYESLLKNVKLLESLKEDERHKIADALESVDFADGQTVVKQGESGEQFYMIESGHAVVHKTDKDGIAHEVNRLTDGSYFGELALLNDSPRAATVTAVGNLKCAKLGKKAFTRLLGPVLDILKRNSHTYNAILNEQQSQ